MNLYDLLAAGLDPAEVLARLPSRDRKALGEAWAFWARPGQHWTPGPEFITDYEAGRGWGKDYAISNTLAGETVAGDPERWGGYAIIVGPDPTQVKRDCLFGPSGIFPAAERSARAGLGPGIVERNLVDRWLRFEAPRGGGGGGLTVYWASSYDPKSVHGANIGLVWWDEFGVSYHNRIDEQGNNAWRALLPAVRAGPDPKIIITQTPSRAPEVRALQADAERPECPTCRRAWLARNSKYLGEVLKEPWRLPTSPQRALHPLLNTRTTEPVRMCGTCGDEVVARVRTVFGDTRDNPAIAAVAREQAAAELATGQAHAYLRFAPRGEVDAQATGALVRYDDIRQVPHVAPEHSERGPGPVADRWAQALGVLGVDEVVVVVDPAVTATQGSDESGVVAAGLRRVGEGAGADADAREQVVGLQDWSVRPDEVDGAPSLVWAPRAYWLACLWGASRIVVETNQGGEEVLSAVRDLVGAPPSEAAVLARLRAEFVGMADARLASLARRVSQSARRIRVEHVHRRADKETRFEWYGRTAARGQQAVLCSSWLGGPQHWATTIAQVTGYEPPRPGAPRTRPRKDRGDALVSAAQVLLRVTETHRGEVVEAAAGWMGKVNGRLR